MKRTPDLTGKRFGMLVVVSQSVELYKGKRQSMCQCVCDCGNTAIVAASRLQKADGSIPRSPTRSCGCSKTLGDLSGQRFGRLVVLSELEPDRYGRRWLCRCDCGNETSASANALHSGIVKSCGCLRDDISKMLASQAVSASRASHTAEAISKRIKSCYGDPGSEARKAKGAHLRKALKESGVIVDHANIPKIASCAPMRDNPYRGVCWNERKNSWMAYCQVNGARWQKSGFKTPEDAKAARDKMQHHLVTFSGLTEQINNYKSPTE